jgi:hypothetical protein
VQDAVRNTRDTCTGISSRRSWDEIEREEWRVAQDPIADQINYDFKPKPSGRRGRVSVFLEVLAQRDVATDVDKRIWGDVLVDDQRRERISAEVPALE